MWDFGASHCYFRKISLCSLWLPTELPRQCLSEQPHSGLWLSSPPPELQRHGSSRWALLRRSARTPPVPLQWLRRPYLRPGHSSVCGPKRGPQLPASWRRPLGGCVCRAGCGRT
ncbi:hypothetical protein MRB53_018390 [Persea americana]|uniref:Uncharacterized protein n=1 Tax=Persea americana TaxID=3435 RepID=A0ACC2M7B9_PERAE|nr:hypothetical protein MRB53_018390 [Persea americana]